MVCFFSSFLGNGMLDYIAHGPIVQVFLRYILEAYETLSLEYIQVTGTYIELEHLSLNFIWAVRYA